MEVMHQPAPGKPYVEQNITINNEQLNVVEKFMYLGTTLSRNVVIDDKVNAILGQGFRQTVQEHVGQKRHHNRDKD
jgi:hypothetical protein